MTPGRGGRRNAGASGEAVAARCTVGHSSRTFRLDVGYACTTEHHREVSSLAWRPDPAGGRWPLTLPVVLFLRHRRATRGCRPVVYPGRVRRRTMVETDFRRRRADRLDGGAPTSTRHNARRSRIPSSAHLRPSRSRSTRRRLALASPVASAARNVREERNANGVTEPHAKGSHHVERSPGDEEVRGLLLEQG